MTMMTIKNSTSRPGKRNLEKAYPARLETSVCPATMAALKNSEFQNLMR